MPSIPCVPSNLNLDCNCCAMFFGSSGAPTTTASSFPMMSATVRSTRGVYVKTTLEPSRPSSVLTVRSTSGDTPTVPEAVVIGTANGTPTH